MLWPAYLTGVCAGFQLGISERCAIITSNVSGETDQVRNREQGEDANWKARKQGRLKLSKAEFISIDTSSLSDGYHTDFIVNLGGGFRYQASGIRD